MSGGEIALLVAAIAWAVLVVALVLLSLKLFQVLEGTRRTIDEMRSETVPLLLEVRGSVTTANKNLEHADELLISVTNITRTVERISRLFDQFVSVPLIKGISVAYGAQRAYKRFRGAR